MFSFYARRRKQNIGHLAGQSRLLALGAAVVNAIKVKAVGYHNGSEHLVEVHYFSLRLETSPPALHPIKPDSHGQVADEEGGVSICFRSDFSTGQHGGFPLFDFRVAKPPGCGPR